MNYNIDRSELPSGIYQIRNRVNGKVYVGQSNNVFGRKAQHSRALKDGKHYNKHMQRSFITHGIDNFVYEVLEYCEVDKLSSRERHWIKLTGSEYADKGFNMAYAYALFKGYDADKVINKGKRKPVDIKHTEESRRKQSVSLRKHFDSVDVRRSLSESRSTLSTTEVKEVKHMLADRLDLGSDEIAELLNVSKVIVSHIRSIASHQYVEPNLNYVVKNRRLIYRDRQDRAMTNMYRDGQTYKYMSEQINVHQRTVIRNIGKIKTEHDDRCRLNTMNIRIDKMIRMTNILHNKGLNDVQIGSKLNVGRGTVKKLRTSTQGTWYRSVEESRGKTIEFGYTLHKKVHSTEKASGEKHKSPEVQEIKKRKT